MVHKTHTTNPNGYGQPVRFYKAVAITFLCLTLGLLAVIVFMSAKRAEITIVTRADSVDVNFPVEIRGATTDAPVKGSATSTIITFEKTFQPNGLKKTTTSGSSVGMATLFNDSATAQPLVATTRLLSPTGILYRLKKGVTVPVKGKISAEIYPDKSDESSTINAPTDFNIPGLAAARQKEVYAKSEQSLSGVREVGVISDTDLKQATDAFVEALKEKATEMATSQFTGQKAFGFVSQYTTDSDKKIGTEADSFSLKGKATIVMVSYKPEDLNQYAGTMLSKKIVGSSDVLQSTNGEPVVSFDSYDMTKNSATLKVSYTGTVNLDPNSRQLQKSVFFGKNEDEVRRYVMSLDHVQSVGMNFKPLWNHTVPQVADHVTVMVKQVE